LYFYFNSKHNIKTHTSLCMTYTFDEVIIITEIKDV